MTDNFTLVKIILFAILCPKLGAITGNEFAANEVKVFGNAHGSLKHFANTRGIVFSEVRNGVVIRRRKFNPCTLTIQSLVK